MEVCATFGAYGRSEMLDALRIVNGLFLTLNLFLFLFNSHTLLDWSLVLPFYSFYLNSILLIIVI